MVTNSLAEKLLLWGQLKVQIMELEEDIKVKVLDLKENQTAGKVRATYREGRGVYDWKAIGNQLPLNEEAKKKHTATSLSIDWKKYCEEIGVPGPIKEENYSVGKPGVSLKIEAK